LPVALVVVDRDLKVIYANDQMKRVLEHEPKEVDEKFLSHIERMGIKELNLEAFKNTILKLFTSKEPGIETIDLGKYAFMSSTKIVILREQGKQEVVVTAFRGERQAGKV
ncbi:MAG: hypothetical protein HY747_11820, partial [Elusimicrobia bacterium]|nr:hypothetical protein [Elusimicrobiota bacterium]